MTIGHRLDAARQIQTLFAVGPVGDLSDAQLLDRFATRDGDRAEMAFAALVERHGPMVLRTCRAVLRDGHDAHDAFQATFLVLARRARSLWVGESLAAWLHQVARRTALCARSASARRRKHEAVAASLARETVLARIPDDLGEILHAEIDRLPARFREAVVLCLLEGHTHDQAARTLNLPVGTLQSRLARGRERLRSRLTRRGLAPAVAPSTLLVPPTLIDVTARSAFSLASGPVLAGMVPASVLTLFREVSRVMMFSKLKLTAMALLGVGLAGATVMANLDEILTPATASPTKPAVAEVPASGERLTILIEKPDASGKYVLKEKITSQFGESGEVQIRSEHADGKTPGSALNARAARINILADATENPASKTYQVAFHGNKSGQSTTETSVTHVERPSSADALPSAGDDVVSGEALRPAPRLLFRPASETTTMSPGSGFVTLDASDVATATRTVEAETTDSSDAAIAVAASESPKPAVAGDVANVVPASEGVIAHTETTYEMRRPAALVPARSRTQTTRAEGRAAAALESSTPATRATRPKKSPQDLRMDEMERKLDLILKRLDSPKPDSK